MADVQFIEPEAVAGLLKGEGSGSVRVVDVRAEEVRGISAAMQRRLRALKGGDQLPLRTCPIMIMLKAAQGR